MNWRIEHPLHYYIRKGKRLSMLVYVIGLCVSLMLSYIMDRIRITVKGKKIYFYHALISSFPFVIIAGLRNSSIGIDYTSYTVSYYSAGDLGRGREVELLGDFIISAARFFESPVFIIWIYAIINGIGIYLLIYRQSRYHIMAQMIMFLSGYFNWSLNIMRQTSATMIVFLALGLLMEEKLDIKKRIIFALCVVSAMLFHLSAAVYVIILFFPYSIFKKHLKIFAVCLPCCFLGAAGIRTILMIISRHFGFYYRYFNNYYDQAVYTGSLIFINICVSLLVFYTYKFWKDAEMKYSVLSAIQYIATALSLLGNIIPNNARVTYAFFPIVIVLVPELTGLIPKRITRYLWIGFLTVAFLIFFMNSFVINNWGRTIPYEWIWQ